MELLIEKKKKKAKYNLYPKIFDISYKITIPKRFRQQIIYFIIYCEIGKSARSLRHTLYMLHCIILLYNIRIIQIAYILSNCFASWKLGCDKRY